MIDDSIESGDTLGQITFSTNNDVREVIRLTAEGVLMRGNKKIAELSAVEMIELIDDMWAAAVSRELIDQAKLEWYRSLPLDR